MSLLDDAIREHLDLKRRRGADPAEIDRLEREALGPVRRSPHEAQDLLPEEDDLHAGGYPAEEDVPEWADAAEEPESFDGAPEPVGEAPATQRWQAHELEEEFDEPLDYEAEPGPALEREYDPPRHHEIAEEWEAHERPAAEPGGLEPDAPAPVPPAPTPAPTSGGPLFDEVRQRPEPAEPGSIDQETAEYEVESEEPRDPGAPKAAEGDDVLEETPDFLQETPDHDRLWFEQRPPRDFDFDG